MSNQQRFFTRGSKTFISDNRDEVDFRLDGQYNQQMIFIFLTNDAQLSCVFEKKKKNN
jgi:hypothetical protein